jgi:tetratricopeptide (TPR) repeat protein
VRREQRNESLKVLVGFLDHGVLETLALIGAVAKNSEQALQIRKKALGPEHPDTASSLNNLANLCRQMGDYARAEPLFEQALQIRKKALGPEHSDTAQSINNLAALYYQMGAYEKAEPLYHQALQIRKKALGPEHPDTASSLNNLASLYREMGDYSRAEPLYRQALDIEQKALGPSREGCPFAKGFWWKFPLNLCLVWPMLFQASCPQEHRPGLPEWS